MTQKIIQDLGGMGFFGVISICLFFLVFTGALIWSLKQKKQFLNTMGSLPLSDEESTVPTKGAEHHE